MCVCMYVCMCVEKEPKRKAGHKPNVQILLLFYFLFYFLCVFSSWRLEQLWLSWLKINASNSWGPTKQSHTNAHAHMNSFVMHRYICIYILCVRVCSALGSQCMCVCLLCARFSTPTPAVMQQPRQRQRKQEQQCKIRAQIQLLCFPPVTRDKNQ